MKAIKFISILALMLLISVTANAQNSLVGDVNKDGKVNITDAMMVVDIILHGQKELSLSVNEISLEKGSSATIVITSGYGSYTVSSNDTNIADATLSGSTVIITGKNGGTTVVKVIDTISGNMKEVSVTVNDDAPIAYPACPDGNHPHLIDLGLPSGTKWACCNVGATKPEEYGGYYAWGETEEKSYYDWSTYIHCDGSYSTCHDLGSDISGTEYDVAHVKWGSDWVMPTDDEQMELLNNCTFGWTTLNGVEGKKFTSKINGNSIFLPAAGSRWNSGLTCAGEGGYYWSSTQGPDYSYNAYYLLFFSVGPPWGDYYRYYGQSVRPVVRKVSVTVNDDDPISYPACPDGNHPHLIDLGLPSGTKWACSNVGATKPEEYGGYYAWGETEEKSYYYWSNYIHCDGSSDTCHNLGSDISGTEYDVAHVKWGGKWCMPTFDDIKELLNNCTYEWTTLNGVNVGKFTNKINGNSIFLPAAGFRWGGDLYDAGERGYYWSSTQDPDDSRYAYHRYFYSGRTGWGDYDRIYGRSVRPVVRN